MMDLRKRGVVSALLSRSSGKWLLLGGCTGLLCGVLGWTFHVAVDGVSHLVLGLLAHDSGKSGVLSLLLPPLLMVVVLGLGGLIAGWLAHRFAPEAGGGGTGVAVSSYHQQQGRIRIAVPLTKLAASTATLGSGGSAGREGPISLIGAGFATWFSDRLGLGDRDRRVLLAAGIAGGVASLFRAPLAAALYAAEVLYSDAELEAEVLIPAFISSIIGFCTYGLLDNALVGGDAHVAGSSLFHPPAGLGFTVEHWPELVGYLVLTVLIGLSARMFVAFSHQVRHRFAALAVAPWLRPGIGAVITGVVGLVAVGIALASGAVSDAGHDALGVLGSGYGAIDRALNTDAGDGARLLLMALFLLIAFGKMAATACTVGSGGSGGEFAPCIVIGGCLGAAVGFGLQGLPIAPHPAACTIMGMAGFLAATHRTPIAALLMVSEIAGNYHLLIPAMWVTAFSFLISGRISIISGQVAGPVASPAHRGHFFQDVLAGVQVTDALESEGIASLVPTSRLAACRQALRDSRQTVFPVLDDGRLIGVVTLDDLRPLLYNEGADAVSVARDVMSSESWTVTPTDSLASAMRRFNTCTWDELPVVDVSGRLVGLLGRRRCIEVYSRLVDQLRDRRQAEGYTDGGEAGLG